MPVTVDAPVPVLPTSETVFRSIVQPEVLPVFSLRPSIDELVPLLVPLLGVDMPLRVLPTISYWPPFEHEIPITWVVVLVLLWRRFNNWLLVISTVYEADDVPEIPIRLPGLLVAVAVTNRLLEVVALPMVLLSTVTLPAVKLIPCR